MKSELRLLNGFLRVRTPYAPALVERFRAIPGRSFDGDTKEWVFPAVRDVLLMVCDVVGVLPMLLPADIKALAEMDGYKGPVATPVDMAVLNGHEFLVPPFAHQRVDLARLATNDRWLLANEMGSGKTPVVVNRLLQFSRSPEPYGLPALVLCPKSVCRTWRDQLREHGGLACDIIEGDRAKRRDLLLRTPRQIKVANYELLLHSEEDFLKGDWRTLVLDESHRCKNFASQTCRIVRRLSERARYVYALTGTPFPNGLEDAHGVLAAVKPDLLPVSTKTAFYHRYTVRQQTMKDADGNPSGPFLVVGYRNVHELHGYVASISSRVLKSECLDLPDKVYTRRAVRLSGKQATIYRDLKKDAVARLTELGDTLTVPHVLTESLRLLQCVGGFLPDDAGNLHEIPDKAKVAALADVIEDGGDRSLVIWCAFQEEVYWLAAWLADNYKARVSTLTGRMTSGTVRQEMIDRFASGDSRFFVGTAAAGGLGINGLQKNCDTEVYYSRDWRLDSYLQSQDRLHRIGQKNTVNVIKIVAEGTVDEKVDLALDKKEALQSMLLQKPDDLF